MIWLCWCFFHLTYFDKMLTSFDLVTTVTTVPNIKTLLTFPYLSTYCQHFLAYCHTVNSSWHIDTLSTFTGILTRCQHSWHNKTLLTFPYILYTGITCYCLLNAVSTNHVHWAQCTNISYHTVKTFATVRSSIYSSWFVSK
jgi:hypothetical protein